MCSGTLQETVLAPLQMDRALVGLVKSGPSGEKKLSLGQVD